MSMLGKTNSTNNISPNALDAVLQVTSVKSAVVTISKTGITKVDYGHRNAYDSNKYDYFFFIKNSLFNDTPWTVTVTDGVQTATRTIIINQPIMYNFYLNFHVPNEYQEVEYLEATSRGPYIDLGFQAEPAIYEMKMRVLSGVSNNYTYFYGSAASGVNTYSRLNGSTKLDSGFATSSATMYLGQDHVVKVIDTNEVAEQYLNGSKVIGTARTGTRAGSNFGLFSYLSSVSTPVAVNQRFNGRFYYFFITDIAGNRKLELYPCYRKSDMEPGMWDYVGEVFYPNIGDGSFTVGSDVR